MADLATKRGFFGYGCDAVAGVISALILGYALKSSDSILILLAYFASLPLFIVGLGFGLIPCVVASLCGVAAIFATGPVGVAGFYFIAYALPAIVLVGIALTGRRMRDGGIRYTSSSALLLALAMYPCAIFLLVYVQLIGHDGGLLAITTEAFDGMSGHISDMLNAGGDQATPAQIVKIHSTLNFMARIAPGMAMSAWLVATAIVIGMAQSFVQKQEWSLRPPFALAELRLPRWFTVVTLILIAGYFAPAPYNYVALNLAIVAVLAFFFVGLAVIHACASFTRAPSWFLVGFYVLISIIPHLAPLVALAGAVDQWGDFRKRFAAKALSLNTKQGEKK